jgi:phospholipid-binding lipoprotein MlaA
MRRGGLWVIGFLMAGLMGCASLPEGHQADPRDPWERYNRAMFSFNTELDTALVRPLAQGYQAAVPELFRGMVRNFFANLDDVITTVNHFLQAEPVPAATSAGRFLVNSTIGVLGIADPASEFGLQKSREDFGLTLGVWGSGPGPYLVLPLLGPSSLRDGLGTAVDRVADPIDPLFSPSSAQQNAAIGLRLLDTRARLLSAESALDTLSFDRYMAVREAYLARRAQQVNPDASPRWEPEE